eukprot:3869311-Ditylum_brightwellii.AAC.2
MQKHGAITMGIRRTTQICEKFLFPFHLSVYRIRETKDSTRGGAATKHSQGHKCKRTNNNITSGDRMR